MKKPKHSAKQCIDALKRERYSLHQIKAACLEFGFHTVSVSWLSQNANGISPASEDLTNALNMACKGLRVKVKV
jgi:hypothetical protein